MSTDFNVDKDILITHVLNPFDPRNSRVTEAVPFVPGKAIESYIEAIGSIPEGMDLVVSTNLGPVEDLGSLVHGPGLNIVVCAIPKGGDGKSILRTVAMLAVVVVAAYTGQYYAAGWATQLGITSQAGVLAFSAATTAVIATAGGYLVNTVLPITSPKVAGLLDGDWGKSRNYGWGSPTNAIEEGVILPSLIGERRFAPPLINWYRYMPEGEFKHQRLRLQYALADDYLEPVTANDIFINGEALSSYYVKSFLITAVASTDYYILVTIADGKSIQIDWGDGSDWSEIEGPKTSYAVHHTYASSQEYTLRIYGDVFTFDYDMSNIPATNETDEESVAFHHSLGDDAETNNCPWMNDTIVETPFSSLVELDSPSEVDSSDIPKSNQGIGTSYVYTHSLTENVTSLALIISFPDGLWSAVEETVYRDQTFSFPLVTKTAMCVDFVLTVRYRVVGESEWTEEEFSPVLPPSAYTSPFSHTLVIESLTLADYEFQIKYASATVQPNIVARFVKAYGFSGGTPQQFSTNGSNITKVGLGLILPQGLYKLESNGSKSSHNITVTASIKVYGTSTWIASKSIAFNDASTDVLRGLLVFDNLSPERYTVKAYISGYQGATSEYIGKVYADFLQEGTNNDIVYRGVSVLSLELFTSDKLSSMPTVEVKAKCADYETERGSANPAWAAYYRLRMKHGVAESDIIYDEFYDWGAWCYANQYFVNLYLDSAMNLKDVLTQIGICGRASVIQRGTKWGVIQDIARDPVQMFSMENIEAGSFEESFLDMDKKANTVLAWFWDEENDYRKTPVEVRDASISNTEDVRTIEITLYGVTLSAQALKIAMAMLNKTRLVQRTVSWLSDVDAVACQVGDVVFFQHDVTSWGIVTGRVISSTSNTVTIDTAADFSGGPGEGGSWEDYDFRIFLRHQGPDVGEYIDSIEVFAINNPYPGTEVATFTLTSPSVWARTPEADSIVSIGHVTGEEESTENERVSVKKFEILGIERYQEQKFKITAAEYYDDSYVTDHIVTMPSVESGLTKVDLPNATAGWNLVGNVRQDYVRLTWFGNAAEYFIFQRIKVFEGWSAWVYLGSTTRSFFDVYRLQQGHTYQFAVSSIVSKPLSGAVIQLVYTVQAIEPGLLPAITNLEIVGGGDVFGGSSIEVTWDVVTYFSFFAYTVEIRKASDPNTLYRTELVVTNKFLYTYEMNCNDHSGHASADIRIVVYVIDEFGNAGDSSYIDVDKDPLDDVTNIRVAGTESSTTFETKDLSIEWDPPAVLVDFNRYVVEIRHGVTLKRTYYTITPNFDYTLEMNKSDGDGTPSSTITVTIYVEDSFGFLSTGAQQVFNNYAPNAVAGLAGRAYMAGAEFYWTESSALDLSHYLFQCVLVVSEGTPSWPEDWSFLSAPSYVRMMSETESQDYQEIYFRVKVVDVMGNESTVETAHVIVDQLYVEPTPIEDFSDISAGFPKIPVVVGATFTNNSPSSGRVSWNAHQIFYNGTGYSISSGSTGVSSGNDAIYIWWQNGSSSYLTSTAGVHPAASMTNEDFIIAVNVNGSHTIAWNAIANQVIGSAYIQKAAINDLHVNTLSATKVTAGSILTPGVYIGPAYWGTSGSQSLDSLKPAEVGATAGATWGTNLNSIPIRFGNSPSGSGLCVTATYMGYYTGSAWKNYFDSSGNFYFAGDSNNYISWNGSTFDITTNKTVTIKGGGDLVIVGADSSPGELLLKGSSYHISFSANTAGAQAWIIPSNDNLTYFYLGVATYRYKELHINAVDFLIYANTKHQGNFLPSADYTYHLGSSSYKWSDLYCKRIGINANVASSNSLIITGPGSTSSTYGMSVWDSGANLYFYCRDDKKVWCYDGAWYTSDAKEKEEIVEVGFVSGKMLGLKPKTFKLKTTGDFSAGFLAQELEAICPEAVTTFRHPVKRKQTEIREKRVVDKTTKETKIEYEEFESEIVVISDDETYVTKNGPLLAYFAKWNQEQQEMIDALMSRIEDLEKIIST